MVGRGMGSNDVIVSFESHPRYDWREQVTAGNFLADQLSAVLFVRG